MKTKTLVPSLFLAFYFFSFLIILGCSDDDDNNCSQCEGLFGFDSVEVCELSNGNAGLGGEDLGYDYDYFMSNICQ